jgi:dodecin
MQVESIAARARVRGRASRHTGHGRTNVEVLDAVALRPTAAGRRVMSVYRVTEVIGTSGTSWEDAAAEAIRTAGGTIRDLRVAEVVKQDIHLDEGGGITYRIKLQLSFKYEQEH